MERITACPAVKLLTSKSMVNWLSPAGRVAGPSVRRAESVKALKATEVWATT